MGSAHGGDGSPRERQHSDGGYDSPDDEFSKQADIDGGKRFISDDTAMHGKVHRIWARFDDKYMKPYFGGAVNLEIEAEKRDPARIARKQNRLRQRKQKVAGALRGAFFNGAAKESTWGDLGEDLISGQTTTTVPTGTKLRMPTGTRGSADAEVMGYFANVGMDDSLDNLRSSVSSPALPIPAMPLHVPLAPANPTSLPAVPMLTTVVPPPLPAPSLMVPKSIFGMSGAPAYVPPVSHFAPPQDEAPASL
jgi:hypothetical protein